VVELAQTAYRNAVNACRNERDNISGSPEKIGRKYWIENSREHERSTWMSERRLSSKSASINSKIATRR
jgi:hypothetical protein